MSSAKDTELNVHQLVKDDEIEEDKELGWSAGNSSTAFEESWQSAGQ